MIVDDISTSIRDEYRSLPDEFVTGPLRPILREMNEESNNSCNKDQIETMIASVAKIMAVMEKNVSFGNGKKEDVLMLSKEWQSLSKLPRNWAGSNENLMRFVSEIGKIAMVWKDFAQDYEKEVIEPLKIFQVKKTLF